jgi:hypothetical protein
MRFWTRPERDLQDESTSLWPEAAFGASRQHPALARLRALRPTPPTVVIVSGAALLLLVVYGVVPAMLWIPALALLLLGAGLVFRSARKEGLDLPHGAGGP